jgi:hypothetical protein
MVGFPHNTWICFGGRPPLKISRLTNLVLLISVIAGTFLVLESFFEKNLITKIPVKLQFSLPLGLAVLAQSSKAGRIPENYIAIVGDSYAHGKGDWLLEINPNTNDAFHSAHVLQELSGRDVISFGKSGASNIKGWVRDPIAKYQFIHDNIDASLTHPEIILAYFYAGNDLLDNLLDIRESFIPRYGETALMDDVAWNEFFLSSIEEYKVGPFSVNSSNLGWLPRATFKVLQQELKTKKTGVELGDIRIKKTGKVNSVWINGKEVDIPDRLQSPALELSQSEIEQGFLVFTRSLAYLKNFFNKSRIIVVYIPAVIESYARVSEEVSIFDTITKIGERIEGFHTSSELMQRSDELAGRVKTITESLGLVFIDTRSDIRAASAKQIIHGPIDWMHYNRPGYEVLAQSITSGLIKQNVLESPIGDP